MAVMTLRIEGSMALFHMQESLQKLESLDVKRVYPGHGKPFCSIKNAIAKSKEKIERYLLDRDLLGNDLIKKIVVYTLLMKKTIHTNHFFPYLMDTYRFKETVDLYFNGKYEMKYNEIMNTFFERGIIELENEHFFYNGKAIVSIAD